VSHRAPIAVALALALVSCRDAERVDARDYDSFWVWAGVDPGLRAEHARTIYLLDGEVRAGEEGRFIDLRPNVPHLRSAEVWLVIRTDTLDWRKGVVESLGPRTEAWVSAGNRVAGVQIDFDARTRHLADYASFLQRVRSVLPRRYKLSITGLMDWSANGDPGALVRMKGIVDEIVIQTYQGRSTIWGYEHYFERMRGFPIPFKVGLVENGRWIEPAALRSEPNFTGYVVFLLPARRGSTN
jgi:hypothetical protein